jgi:hypothetical protein
MQNPSKLFKENPKLFDKAAALWAVQNALENMRKRSIHLEFHSPLVAESGTQSVRPFVNAPSSQVLE